MDFWRTNYGLFCPVSSAKQSAIRILDLTRCLDWLYDDKPSPFQVRRYKTKKVQISNIDEYGRQITRIESKSIRYSHLDSGLLCTSFKTIDSNRVDTKGLAKTIDVLENYDRIGRDLRKRLKMMPVNKLIAWLKKHNRIR